VRTAPIATLPNALLADQTVADAAVDLTPPVPALQLLLLIAAALIVLLLALGATVAESRKRYRLAWNAPDRLLTAEDRPVLITTFITLFAITILAVAGTMLVPLTEWWAGGPRASATLFVSGIVSAAGVWLSLRWGYSHSRAILAAALLAVGLAGGLRLLLWDNPNRATHAMLLMLALAVGAAFWVWLTGVWQQQLDGGRAWTVAGRVLALARTLVIAHVALAVLCGWAIPLGRYRGDATQVEAGVPVGQPGVGWVIAAHVITGLVLARRAVAWRSIGCGVLFLATAGSMLWILISRS
jgi:hypothetical protein